jgi:hypothetical protein
MFPRHDGACFRKPGFIRLRPGERQRRGSMAPMAPYNGSGRRRVFIILAKTLFVSILLTVLATLLLRKFGSIVAWWRKNT